MATRWLCGLVVAAALACALRPPVDARRGAGGDAPSPGAAALRAYRDPVTGRFGPPPPGTAPAGAQAAGGAGARAALPTLRERPSPIPGGGVIVDLEGRFDSALVAVRDGDGAVRARCADATTGAASATAATAGAPTARGATAQSATAREARP